MSLSWDLTAIVEKEKICWVPIENQDGMVEMGALTNALVWATMLVGMNSITAKNSKEFHKRLIEFEIVHGTGMLTTEGTSRQPSLQEIQSHVGLKTNATPMTTGKWGSYLKKLVTAEADRRIKILNRKLPSSVQGI